MSSYVFNSTGVFGVGALEVFFDRPADVGAANVARSVRMAADGFRLANTSGADAEFSLDAQATWIPLLGGEVYTMSDRVRNERNSLFIRRTGGVDGTFRLTASVS